METEPSCPHGEWVRRFSVCFQALQPIVTEQQSIDVAMAAFPSSNDLEPEDAAAVFSEILDASVPLNELNRPMS
jgi:hypothetical protein